MNSTSPERIAIGALGNIAVAPGAIASITRLRRAAKLVPLPFEFIEDNYAMARPLALVALAHLRKAGPRHLQLGHFDFAGSIRAALLRIGIRGGGDKQRTPTRTHEEDRDSRGCDY